MAFAMTSVKRHRFISLGEYELRLVDQVTKQLQAQAKADGQPVPTGNAVINGLIRTAVHTVFGQDYLYTELLSAETFRELMAEAGMSEEEVLGHGPEVE